MADAPPDEIARYRRARAVFDAVVDLDGPARDDAIASACAGDDALHALVARLVAAEARALTFDTAAWREELPEEPEEPVRIGRFRVLRELGRGGMGVVYEAEQDAPRRRVAVKTLLPLSRSAAARARFRTEVDALGRVLHPGIPQVYEVFTTDDGTPAMAMERVDGAPLLQAVYLLDVAARVEMLARVCDAVDHAHRHGVIHRDLTPDNVLVTPSGQPKVLDFGIARLDGAEVEVAGTLAYLAPEQLEGAAPDVASDVFSLGAVGWEMLTGDTPWEVRTHDPLDAIARARRAPLGGIDGVPEAVVDTLRTALAADPAARFPSARRMARALRDAVARPRPEPTPPPAPAGDRFWLGGVAGFVAGAASVMALWWAIG